MNLWLDRMPPGTRVGRITLRNGIALRVYEHGERDAPVVLFLHGFPERAVSWRSQLALPGFRCVAPDLRGFGGSDHPRGRWHYRMGALLDDVCGLLDHLGAERAHVVAHDWGGALAWELAMDHPDRVRSLVTLNGPPLPLMLRALGRPAQLRKSWYFFFFQLPVLPERRIGAAPGAVMARTFRGVAGRPEVFDRETLAPYVEQAERGFRGVDWYRGALLEPRTAFRHVRCPVHVLWGMEDRALESDVFTDPMRYGGWVHDLTITEVPGVGHWVQQEAPAVVDRVLRGHLAAHA